MIPGINLLAVAMTAIAPQVVQYRAWLGKVTNDQGEQIPTYADPLPVTGSFQPVSLDRKQILGLNISNSYATFYATGAYKPVFRNTQPDQIVYNGRVWYVTGLVDWFSQDGWQAVLLEDMGPAS